MEQAPLGYNPRTSTVSYAEPPSHATRLDFDHYVNASNPKRQKYSLKRKLSDVYSSAPPGPSNPKKLMSVEAAKHLQLNAQKRSGHYDVPGWYHRFYDDYDSRHYRFDPGWLTYYNKFSIYPRHRRKTSRPRMHRWIGGSELIRSRRFKNKSYPFRRSHGYKWQSRGKPQPTKFGRSWQYTLN